MYFQAVLSAHVLKSMLYMEHANMGMIFSSQLDPHWDLKH